MKPFPHCNDYNVGMTLRKRLERDLREQGAWSTAAEELVRMVADSLRVAADARAIAAEEGIVVTNHGARQRHPGITLALDAERAARAGLKDLGLTPADLRQAAPEADRDLAALLNG